MISKRTEELLRWDREHVIHPKTKVGQLAGIVFEKSHGVYLVDTEGKEYIDFSAFLACCNLGHGQKKIINAIIETLSKTDYMSTYAGFGNVENIECARKLAELTPGDLNHFYFTCGGSESIDSAIKIAHLYWHYKGKDTKYKIISLYNAYHGLTGISTFASATRQGVEQIGFGPPPPGFLHIPPFYCYHCIFGLKYPDCEVRCAWYLENVIKSEGPDSIAAFLAEPIQGAGGTIVPPPEYWLIVRKICTEHDVLLIADEIMTGFTRTGKMFGMENWNVIPDIMTMAKGIAASYLPFGAVGIGNKVYEGLSDKMLHQGFTFSGHPICSAASLAAMDIYIRERVAENAAKVGKHIRERLDFEFLPLPCVGDVGGMGMLQAFELVNDKKTKAPLEPTTQAEFQQKVYRNGLYVRIVGNNRMRISPPCIMTIEEVDNGLDILLPLVAELKPK